MILASFSRIAALLRKMSKLSMPAQGYAMSKVAVRRGLAWSVTVRRGITPAVAKFVWMVSQLRINSKAMSHIVRV